jgi:hypothetical protein
LGGVVGPVLLLFGLKLASSASVSLWLNLELIATVLFGYLVFRDKLSTQAWVATVGTLAAATLLSISEGYAGVQAGLLVTLACFCWGLDNHFTALITGITPAQTTFWKGLVAGIINLVIGLHCHGLFDCRGSFRWCFLLWHKPPTLHHLSPKTWCHSKPDHLLQCALLWGHLGRNFSQRTHFNGSNYRHFGYYNLLGVSLL